MIAGELLAIAPTAEALLRLIEEELELVLLGFVRAVSNDLLHRMGATCNGILTQLFGSQRGWIWETGTGAEGGGARVALARGRQSDRGA
jgi:hypothetical protein